MKTVAKLLAALYLFALHAHAQLSLSNGGFQVKFPTRDWIQQQPPAALRDPIAKGGGKILMFVESPNGRFIVSRFDYPPTANHVGFVAGFVGGVRKSTAQTGAKIEEHIGSFGPAKFPSYSFDRDIQDNFVHSEAIFCTDKLYNVQVVGPKTLRDELMKLLDGVTIRDTPMPRAMFDKGLEPNALARNVAYEMGRRFGYVVGVIVVVVIAVLGLIFVMGGIGGRKSKPPPLPPQA